MDSVSINLLGHDPVHTFIVAAIACYAALFICRTMLEAAIRLPQRQQVPIAILVQITTGMAIWAAHFLIIESYPLSNFATYDGPLTMISLVLVIAGLIGSLMVRLRSRGSRYPKTIRLCAGLIGISGVLVMYYTSMAGFAVDNLHLNWTPVGVAVAISLPLFLAPLAAVSQLKRQSSRTMLYAACGTIGFCWLHYVDASLIYLTQGGLPPALGITPYTLQEVLIVIVSVLILSMTFIFSRIWHAQSGFMLNLQSSLEAMPVGLGIYDARDRLMLWNQTYANLNPKWNSPLRAGMTYREVLRSGLKDSILPGAGGHSESWIEEQVNNQHEGDWLHPQANNDTWVRLQKCRTNGGGLVSVITDFTAHKRHEQQLAEALDAAKSANVAKSRFLANMSHEIRTPLNGVVAVADALGRTKLNHSQQEMVELICASSRSLQTLLSDILDLARVESGQMILSPESFDLEQLVRETSQLHASAAHEKGVAFSVHVAHPARTWVVADPMRTKQILGNLLSNAVKFTHGGYVTVNVELYEGQIRFTVADTGIGFDPSLRERLFGRFEQADNQVTRSYGGSGLGLSICSELAAMMGGSLDCTSVQGAGSIFTLLLPWKEGKAPSADAHLTQGHAAALQKPTRAQSKEALRILLADDNITNRRVVQLLMASSNVTITEVEHGLQAVEAYNTGAFDLVLMDMQMPVMDGLTATQTIRDLERDKPGARIPIIMLTANAMPEHVRSSLDAGADAHLAKPFNVSQLLELTYNLTVKTSQPAQA